MQQGEIRYNIGSDSDSDLYFRDETNDLDDIIRSAFIVKSEGQNMALIVSHEKESEGEWSLKYPGIMFHTFKPGNEEKLLGVQANFLVIKRADLFTRKEFEFIINRVKRLDEKVAPVIIATVRYKSMSYAHWLDYWLNWYFEKGTLNKERNGVPIYYDGNRHSTEPIKGGKLISYKYR